MHGAFTFYRPTPGLIIPIYAPGEKELNILSQARLLHLGQTYENFLSLCINSRHGRTVLPGKIARHRATPLTSLFDNVIFLAELPYFLSWYYQRLSAIL